MPSAKCLTAHPAPTKPTLPLEVYLQAVSQADLAISITDPAANILFANETFTRVTGYALGEVVGNNESMLSNRTTPREIYQSMWTALMEQRPWSGKLLNRKKSGQLYLAELTISPVVDAAGKTTHYLGMHRDITEFHRLEQMVRNQKALIESVVDAAPIAIALLDRKGRVLLDKALRDGEAQTRAPFAPGDQRIEHAFQNVARNTRSVIDHLNFDGQLPPVFKQRHLTHGSRT